MVFSRNRAAVAGRRLGTVGFAVLCAMVFGAAPARAFVATEGVARTVNFDVTLPCPQSGNTFNCSTMPASAPLNISWGDGGTNTATAATDVTVCHSMQNSVDPLGCDYLASVGHTYAEETPTTPAMPYPVQATIMFNGVNHRDLANTSATVSDAPLTVSNLGGTAVEGSTVAVALAQLSDPGGVSSTSTAYAVSIKWGDGSPPDNLTGAVLSTGAVTGSHAYAQAGTYMAQVTVTDDGGASTSFQSAITVSDPPPVVSSVSGATATEGAATLLNVATFVDPGGSVMASNFSASIDWGDGTTSSGTVSAPAAPGGAFTVSAHHTYGEEGTWPARVTITDLGGGSASSVTTAVAVSDAGLAAAGGGTLHLQEGVSGAAAMLATFGDADPSAAVGDFTATVDWGDGTASTPATVSSAGGGRFAVTGAHAYAEEGSFTATVAIKDGGGATVSTTTAVVVVDQPLSATGVATLKAVARASTGTLTVASFADADPGGTANDYAATINWGDGSAVHAGRITTVPGGRFAVVGAHTYAASGTFRVRIRITDSGGAAASVTSTASVAPARIQSTLVYQFTLGPTFTRFTSLVVRRAPIGGQIQIRCKGTGCGRRTLAIAAVAAKCMHARCHTARTIDLAARVQRWRLAPGAQLTVEILRRGWVGKYYSFRIRRRAPPAVFATCIAPGARKPGVGC